MKSYLGKLFFSTYCIFTILFGVVIAIHAEQDGTQTIYTTIPAKIDLTVGEHGSVTIDGEKYTKGDHLVQYDVNWPISLCPDEGYSISEVLLDGKNITYRISDDVILVGEITDDAKLTVYFKVNGKSADGQSINRDNNMMKTIGNIVPNTSDRNIQWLELLLMSTLVGLTCFRRLRK